MRRLELSLQHNKNRNKKIFYSYWALTNFLVSRTNDFFTINIYIPGGRFETLNLPKYMTKIYNIG